MSSADSPETAATVAPFPIFAQACESQCQYAHEMHKVATGCAQSGCLWLAHHPDDPTTDGWDAPIGAAKFAQAEVSTDVR